MSVAIFKCSRDETVAFPCAIGDYTVTQWLGNGVDCKVYLAHKTTDKKNIKAIKVSLRNDENWHRKAGWWANHDHGAHVCLANLARERWFLQRLDETPYIVKAFFEIDPEMDNVSFMEAGCLTLQDLHEFWGNAEHQASDLKWIAVAEPDEKERSTHERYSLRLAPKQEFAMGRLTRYFAAQILCGITHVHQKGIAHSDIKGSNILIMPDTTIRICDFGSARDAKGKDNGQVDLERLGCTVWLMGTGQMSYYYTLPLSNLKRLTEADQVDPALNTFCGACYNEGPNTLSQHPWLMADDQFPLDVASDRFTDQLKALARSAFAEVPEKVREYLTERGVDVQGASYAGMNSRTA